MECSFGKMADGSSFPVVAFTLIAGVIVVVLIYVTKLVKSVAKATKIDVQDPPKRKTDNFVPFATLPTHRCCLRFFQWA